tara:strand:- start:187 stop:1188 length:1002 start_codon:yes stop_codon:yes gene_type:complete
MKKALVTGGCGFIGSNLTKELVKQGWQVDVVDDMSNGHLELLEGLNTRVLPSGAFYTMYNLQKDIKRGQDEVLVIQDDFADDNILLGIDQGVYDVIFHQAAVPRVSYSVEEPWHTTDVNISKTVRLFAAARESVRRIVWASSSSVYGGADILPTKETQPKNPKSPYAWQKSAIEDFAKQCWDLYKLDIVCLRYFNVFGPGQYGDSPYSTAVSAWCHAIKNGLECRSDGDGEQSRDMCYIDNVVHANIRAANYFESFEGECYNVACGDRVSNNEILDYLKNRFGDKVKVRNAPERAGDVKHTQADITKIHTDIGYTVQKRFWEGLEETIKWWGI